ncbi:hypothetical protein KW798_01105 [Candidatus Parcubacteria bacterium]|nr:hypothetical protein [Candidatus Parcubacteria bacterium]
MEFIKANKWMIGGVLGAVVLVWVYFTYFSGGSSDQLLTSTDPASTAVTQELITTLANLKTIKLDASIFKDPLFVSLSDFGVVIPPQQTGRRNPFAPLGGFTAPSTGGPSH